MDQREKYRIRIYNHNAERITLECKEKIRRKTSKSSCPITLLQCRQLMEGVIPVDIEPDQQVLHKLAYRMAVKLMRPVVIVDYNRVPYVYRLTDANVRITFDYHITSVSDVNFSDIFKKDFLTAYTNGSVSVLEVTAVLMVTAVIACYIFLAYRLITRKTFYSKTFNISLAAIAVITAVKEPLDLVFLFWSIAVGICCGAHVAEIAIVLSVLLTILVIVLDRLPIGRVPMILAMNLSDG